MQGDWHGRPLRAQSEKEFQKTVQHVATLRGWKWFHPADNRPTASGVQNIVAGFPDMVLVKDDRLVFAELKTDDGRLTPKQLEWLEALMKTPARVCVWRPRDILNGNIDAVLALEW